MMDRSRFCITGLPRSRTAWLAALLCAHGIETLHEYPPFFESLEALGAWLHAGTEQEPHGYVDGFSIIHHAPLVKAHFSDSPIVIIQRDLAAVRQSWESWNGPVSDDVFTTSVKKVLRFMMDSAHQPNVLIVPYAQLEHYEPVNRLVLHCTGRPLKIRTWQLFHLLKIELHRGKIPSPTALRRTAP